MWHSFDSENSSKKTITVGIVALAIPEYRGDHNYLSYRISSCVI